jgi:hypothetical protein
MADVIFMDGFDSYDSANNQSVRPGVHSKWVIVNPSNIFFSEGRYGGQGMNLGNTAFGCQIRGFFNGNVFQQSATFAFAYKTDFVARAEGQGQMFSVLHNQTSQFAVSVSNIGQLRLWRGNTMVAESEPNIIHTHDWHFFELEYVGHTSAGRATLFIDGVEVLNFNGNTQNAAAYGVNGIQFNAGNESGYIIDDLYVINEATRIGERRIETLRPNGDVTVAFTPSTPGSNYAMLNETLVSANNYVSATALGAKDMYNFSNLTTNPDKIDAIQLNVWAAKTDAETRELATIVKSGSTETTSANYNLPTNHLNMNRIENLNPATGTAWDITSVNAIQAGYEIKK